MKKNLFLITVLFCGVSMSADIAFEVKDVEAHQRYPWNGKVDIDFTIDSAVEGSNFTVSVSAEDTVGKTNVVLSAVRYDDKIPLSRLGKIAAGRHRLTWDGDADVPDTLIPSLAFSVSAWAGETAFPDPELYMVVDLSRVLSSGGQYLITYLPSVPKGGWTDEYKTKKLVLRRIPDKELYAGVFEMTQYQWRLISGKNPSKFTGETLPVENLTYSDVYLMTTSLRERTGGLEFKVPSVDEWRFACRAGTQTEYNVGDGLRAMEMAGWYKENSDAQTHPVGMKLPNAWGLYDMHGNVAERCSGDVNNSSVCGGGWDFKASECTWNGVQTLAEAGAGRGFRVFMKTP